MSAGLRPYMQSLYSNYKLVASWKGAEVGEGGWEV